MNALITSIAKKPLLILLLALVLSAVLFFTAVFAFGKGAFWQGYYVLIFPHGLPDQKVLEAYSEELGLEDLISRETQEVVINAFNRLDKVPLSMLEQKYDRLDPRLDSYVQGLGSYFNGPDNSALVYVKSAEFPVFFYLKSLVFYKNQNIFVRFPDMLGLGQLVFALISLGLMVFVILLYKNRSYWAMLLFCFIPWAFIMAVAGGLPFMLLLGMALPLYSFFKEFFWHLENRLEYSYKPNGRNLLVRAVLLLTFFLLMAVILFAFGQGFFMVRLLIPLGLDFLFVLIFVSFRLLRKRGALYHRFFPVLIPAFATKPTKKLPVHFPVFAPVFFVLVGAFLALPVVEGVMSALSYPVPVYQGPFGLDYQGIRSLWLAHSSERLPDLSDYVAHRYFQENFAYGGHYDFPLIDEEMGSDKYSIDHNKKINQTYTTLKKFDSLWLQHLFDGLSQGNILNLLAEQKNSVSVHYQNTQSALGLRAFWLWVLVFFSLLLVSHFFLDYYLTPSFMCDKKLIAVTE